MRDRKLVYLIVTFAVAMLICTLAGIEISLHYSRAAIEKAERGQCDSIQADLDAYREEPPTTKAGKHQVAAKQARFAALGCPDIEK